MSTFTLDITTKDEQETEFKIQIHGTCDLFKGTFTGSWSTSKDQQKRDAKLKSWINKKAKGKIIREDGNSEDVELELKSNQVIAFDDRSSLPQNGRAILC